MATPLINTLQATTYLYTEGGTGSNPIADSSSGIGEPTGIAQANTLRYDLASLVAEQNAATVLTPLRRPRLEDLVGTWLESSDSVVTAQSSVPAGTYARALDELKENLGVTLTYIARCLGLQRSAVYRWYEGRLPHPANRSRLQTVREFAQAWRAAKLPSLREYWDTPVPAAGATLGELLSAEVLDVTALRGAIKSLVTGTGAMPPKPPRLGFPDRQRNRHKDRERLSVLIPPTSHEDDADEEP